MLTKDTKGCSEGKIDHQKAKNSYWCLCKCYLIVISSQKTVHQGCLLSWYKGPLGEGSLQKL